MAHKKVGGSSKNGRDSIAKRLGIKPYKCNFAMPGNILIRQRGMKWMPGIGTIMGKDYTVHALKAGYIKFIKLNGRSQIIIV